MKKIILIFALMISLFSCKIRNDIIFIGNKINSNFDLFLINEGYRINNEYLTNKLSASNVYNLINKNANSILTEIKNSKKVVLHLGEYELEEISKKEDINKDTIIELYSYYLYSLTEIIYEYNQNIYILSSYSSPFKSSLVDLLFDEESVVAFYFDIKLIDIRDICAFNDNQSINLSIKKAIELSQ